MDVFNIHDQLIEDYSTYIRSFINIADERIGEHVVKELEDGALWPDPQSRLFQVVITFLVPDRLA